MPARLGSTISLRHSALVELGQWEGEGEDEDDKEEEEEGLEK